ncbi:MAG: flavin reductase family protein [Chloroflexi bacterium]|nr:flavin reductase family protein [Chloroflexota bacterium]
MSLQELQSVRVMDSRQWIEGKSDLLWSEPERPSVSAAAFRQAFGQLAAGVSIVTTQDRDGQMLGMTATSVTSLSLDPPLLLVCVDNRTRTAAALTDDAPFVVQFLAQDQEALARQFASPAADKFANVAYRLTESGAPAIEGALATLECLPYALYPGGDHTIVVGRIVDVQVADIATSPLLYFQSRFLNIGPKSRG